MLLPIITSPNLQGGGWLTRDSNGRIYVTYSMAPLNSLWVTYSDDQGNTWQHENIEAMCLNPVPPRIAIDSLDRLHCVYDTWGILNPGVSNIRYRRRTASGWEAPVQITDTAWAHFGPSLAVDSIDNVHVVWNSTFGGLDHLYHRQRTTAGWGPITTVLTNPIAGSVADARIAIGPNDVLHVGFDGIGWPVSLANTNIKYIARIGGAWGAMQDITDVAFDQEQYQIATDLDNNVHFAWHGLGWGANPGNYNIRYQRLVFGGALDPQEAVTDEPFDIEGPYLSLDAGGDIFVSYNYDFFPGNVLHYRERKAGVWQVPVFIFPNSGCGPHIYSFWPLSNNLRNNIPADGFASIIFDAGTLTLYLYFSPVFFWVAPAPPAVARVATLPATAITEFSAQINGMVENDAGFPGDISFEWGITPDYGMQTPWFGGFASGSTFFALISPLAPGTSYHFRARFRNRNGIVYGTDASFSTLVSVGMPVMIDDAALLRLLEVN